MCQCTPTIRTPWCGKPGCEAPAQKRPDMRSAMFQRFHLLGVRQTIYGRGPDFGEEPGNCMQAALATVLGQRLEAVPHFLARGDADWWDQMNNWLLLHFSCALMGLQAGDWQVPPVLHLMQGKTVRGSSHVVVGYAGELLWDPHQDETGLSEVQTIEMFTAIDPRHCRGM